MSSLGRRYWTSLRRSVLLVRGARENAHDAMLEIQLQMSRRRQAAVAFATAGWPAGD